MLFFLKLFFNMFLTLFGLVPFKNFWTLLGSAYLLFLTNFFFLVLRKDVLLIFSLEFEIDSLAVFIPRAKLVLFFSRFFYNLGEFLTIFFLLFCWGVIKALTKLEYILTFSLSFICLILLAMLFLESTKLVFLLSFLLGDLRFILLLLTLF